MPGISISKKTISFVLLSARRFSVIGFFEKNSAIYAGRYGFLILDQFIVMPSFHVQKSALSTDGLKIHYANKTSGIIELPSDSYINTYCEIEDELNLSGCGKYSLSLYPLYAQFRKAYGISLYVAYGLISVLWGSCGVMIVCLFHKFKIHYMLSVKRYIWLCCIPILLYILIERNIGNAQQYMLNIGCIFINNGIILVFHGLTEIVFQHFRRDSTASNA